MSSPNSQPPMVTAPASCRRARVALFTLMELIVAVTVFVLVLSVVVAVSSAVSHSWERLRREQDRFARLMSLDRALDNILSNAIPFLWSDEANEQVPFFRGERDALRLAYRHYLANPADGAIRFVELVPEDGRLTARYCERPYSDNPEDGGQPRTTVLAEGLEDVSFAYADYSRDGRVVAEDRLVWVDEWDPDRAEMPVAVLVSVTWQDGRTESWLRRTAGSAYRERFGTWKPADDTSEN